MFGYYFIMNLIIVSIWSQVASFEKDAIKEKISAQHRTYYFSNSGNDTNNGSKDHPLKSLSAFNKLALQSGDIVYFKAGDIFKGNISIDSSKYGTAKNNICISSYGNGTAIIDAGDLNGITINNSSFINISNLQVKGSGRKTGNTKDGVMIVHSTNITTKKLDVSGFQKSGLLIYSSVNITNVDVYAHNNGAAGITVEGYYENKITSRNIKIIHCSAVNNPGDPTKLDNHSGNGIVVGHCTNVLIKNCMATNNGWDMPRIGNGPVGIWAYEADCITISHCLAYRNKTSVGGADGGGFDFDGGVTNSVIQYCLSYQNQGAGYCMFQYWGATPWHNNLIRFNISEDDGTVSDGRGGVYVWNSSDDDKQFYNCDFYNNTIYNQKEAALSYSEKSKRENFRFFNNIFVAKDSLIRGDKSADIFSGNDWWSIDKKFNADGMSDLESWATKYNVEKLHGKLVGSNIDPLFLAAAIASVTIADSLSTFINYQLPQNSVLRTSGLDLKKWYHINNGGVNYFSTPAPVKGIGACF